MNNQPTRPQNPQRPSQRPPQTNPQNKRPQQMQNKQEEKTSVLGVVSWIVVLLAFAIVLFTVISLRNGGVGGKTIFGLRADVVVSDSMSATDFSAGDLIVTKRVDPTTLKEGDIIAFISQNSENYGQVVTHKIRSLTRDMYGNPAFVTYGTTTDTNDEAPVPYSAVLGKYTFKIEGVGRFIEFLKTPMGYVVVVLIPFLIVMAIQAVRIFVQYKEYKQAKERAREAYRRKMLRQKREAEMMRAELARMKAAQAAENGAADTAPKEN